VALMPRVRVSAEAVPVARAAAVKTAKRSMCVSSS
jgi:hypothetical protein